jgi:K+-transporting ATPase KdpF subunit
MEINNMAWEYLVSGILAMLLLIYLTVAMLLPEKF